MKVALIIFGLALIGCRAGIKYGESGDDNSHLRNPQYPTNTPSKTLPIPDSMEFNNMMFYLLDRDLMLNGMFVLDTFFIERCYQSIAKPDSVLRGGPKIIAEFGVDDFDIYIGKSNINAGHGQILSFEIRDNNLKLFDVGVGSSRQQFEKMIGYNLPNKDTVNFLGVGDDVYIFRFEKDKIHEIDYFAPPL